MALDNFEDLTIAPSHRCILLQSSTCILYSIHVLHTQNIQKRLRSSMLQDDDVCTCVPKTAGKMQAYLGYNAFYIYGFVR